MLVLLLPADEGACSWPEFSTKRIFAEPHNLHPLLRFATYGMMQRYRFGTSLVDWADEQFPQHHPSANGTADGEPATPESHNGGDADEVRRGGAPRNLSDVLYSGTGTLCSGEPPTVDSQ